MISDIWNNISNFLDILDILNLIKIKILSKKYICQMCSVGKEIIIDDYIYSQHIFFDTQLGIERIIKRRCGIYIRNICSICGHIKCKKIKAQKLNNFCDEIWIKNWKEKYNK